MSELFIELRRRLNNIPNHKKLTITLTIIPLFIGSYYLTSNFKDLIRFIKPVDSSLAEVTSPNKKEPQIEYLSNEILIKLKSGAHSTIKNKVSAVPVEGNSTYSSGIASLDKLNKDNQVIKLEKVVKETSKSKKDHEVFRWYKVTLPGKAEILKDTESLTPPLPPDTFDPSKSLNTPPSSLADTSPQAKEKQKLKEIVSQYKKDPNIEATEFNYIAHTTAVPNDPYYSSTGSWGQTYPDLWGLKKIQMERAWDVATGSAQVTVAVIDTGVDYNHPDISSNIWTNPDEIPANNIDDDLNGFVDDTKGWDFYNNDNDPMDDNGHGTHVAGTIGAIGNNNLGVVGVNWQVKIMPVKFLGNAGYGSLFGAMLSISYGVQNGAKVVNNSWGGAPTTALSDVMDFAYLQDAVLVASAGNNNTDVMLKSPANYQEVIAVAATDSDDQRAIFSNFGSKIDVSAPGVDILSLKGTVSPICTDDRSVGGSFCRITGTSMSAAHVSGLAAIIKASHPDFTNEEIRQVIRQAADKITGKEFDENFGYGRINASNSLSVNNPPPVARVISPKQRENLTSDTDISVSGIVESRIGISKWEVFLGAGDDIESYQLVASGNNPINNNVITTIDPESFIPAGSQSYTFTLRLLVEDINGKVGIDRTNFTVFRATGWPKFVPATNRFEDLNTADLDGDGQLEIVGLTIDKIYVWDKDGVLLPGWPRDLIGAPYSASIGDIAGSNLPEIVSTQNYSVTAFNNLGDTLPGWPTVSSDTFFNFCQNIYGTAHALPTLADVDLDGKQEIIVVGLKKIPIESSIKFEISTYVFKGDGNSLPGWPKVLGADFVYQPTCSLAAGNLVGDSKPEIAITVLGGDGTSSSNYFILDSRGNFLPGWPKKGGGLAGLNGGSPLITDLGGEGVNEVIFGNAAYSPEGRFLFNLINPSNWSIMSISTADFDQDKKPEIALYHYSYRNYSEEINVFRGDGSRLSGWPRISSWITCGHCELKTGDVTGDQKPELLIAQGNKVVALDEHNTQVSSWEADPNFSISSFTIADLDNNGTNEILATGLDSFYTNLVFVFNTSGNNNDNSWPLLRHDSRKGASSYISLDSDGDGCADKREILSNQTYGGRRDYLNPWDFYDVPVPAIKGGQTTGIRDRAVTIGDLLAVQLYVGTSANGPPNANWVDYDNDLNNNGIADGREYDRTASTDPNQPWRSGAPDGVISMSDVLAVLPQIGHSCATPLP